MNIFKNEEFQKNYIDNGFVVTDFINQQQVKEILEKLLSMKPDDNFHPHNRGTSDYHCTFLDTNEVYKRAANKLFKETFNPLVNELMNNYHVWNANFYVKPAHTGKFEMHQNWTHVNEEKYTSLTIWCPLVDTSIQNGTIQLVPGTHKIVPDIATLNTPYYFSEIEDFIAEQEMKAIPLKAGQCVIFEDGMIHYSDINHSESPRYALQILVGPKYTQPVFYYYNSKKPERGFEVFEIDDEFFMKNSYFTMTERPQHQKSLGFIKNSNKQLTKDEYLFAKSEGKNRRKVLYED